MTRNDMYHRAMLRQLGVATYQESPHGKTTAVDHRLEHSGERAGQPRPRPPVRIPPAGASSTPGDGTSGSGTS